MQDKKIRLEHLCEDSKYSPSSIIYCDGIKKISVRFNELHDHVCVVKDFLKPLHSTRLIGVLIEQGLALPAIVLGILKVDSTFAFLDVFKPFKSLSAFQTQVQIKTLIVQERYLKVLASKLCRCWKKTDHFFVFSKYYLLESTNCSNNACPNSREYGKRETQSEIAYVIQTSGTTGEPKIVEVPHSCIVPNIIDLRSKFSVTVDDVLLQSTLMTFDPSIIELFLSLSSGATLIMIPDHIRYLPKRLLQIAVDNNVTVLQGTPSLICCMGMKALKEIILRKDSPVRILALNGENLPSFSKLQQWKSDGNCTEIYNLYGLTEVSCYASCFKVDFHSGKSLTRIPIGEPLLNTKLEIRDENGELSDKGEVFIGGPGRFCIVDNDPWPTNSNSVMRATGDLASKCSDGFIYFEGRYDNKASSHNISPEIISHIVNEFAEVENCFVHFEPTSSILYLFIVLACNKSYNSELESRLVESLRELVFNLPAIVSFPVPFLPVTKHGKVDKKKILNLIDINNVETFSTKSDMGDMSDGIISNVWKSYTNQISIMENDNFILNGGDTLTAVEFVSDTEWYFQMSLPLLIEKILNETFKDVKQYIKLCLEGKYQSMVLSNNNSDPLESIGQPPPNQMCHGVKCFKFASTKGYFEYCFHSKNSTKCFPQVSEVSQSNNLQLSLVLKWDLKKWIDATPCILYVPQFNQHLIFVGSHFGMFSCINVDERVEKWQILVPGRIESSACISSCGNYVLFGCFDHHLYCINIADGSISWKYKTGAEVKSSPSVSSNNKAFVGSHDKHVYAIDVKSGSLLWKKQIPHGSIFSSPLVIEKLCAVCVGTLDGVLALLSMESGDILWKYSSEKPLFSSPAIISNYILVGSTDKCMLCLDLEGKEVFKYSTDGPVFSSPAFLNNKKENVVLFGCHDSHVYCLSLNGDLLWKTLCDSPIYATPLQFQWNNCSYACVTSSKGTLYILELCNGKIVLSRNCPGEIFSSPVFLDNILAVGCRDNNVYCFSLEAEAF